MRSWDSGKIEQDAAAAAASQTSILHTRPKTPEREFMQIEDVDNSKPLTCNSKWHKCTTPMLVVMQCVIVSTENSSY